MAERKAVDWEARERVVEDALRSVFGGAESGVTAEILFGIEMGYLAEAYGWPEIIHAEREYPVPRGRADFLLTHIDGSATVIECKASSRARDILPAVGQVMSYGVQIGYSRVFSHIRLAIASRAPAAETRLIKPVLDACNIQPLFCGMFSKWAKGAAVELFGECLPARAE